MSAQNTSLSRRDFVKVTGFAAALVAAPAAIQAAAPSEALADDQNEHSYECNCTCDVFVPQSVHGMILAGGNAYLTNSNVPTNPLTGPFPNYSISDNAHYETNSDGGITVTVDIVNTGFMLYDITSPSTTDSSATAVASATTPTGVSACPTRITQLVAKLPQMGTEYVFEAKEYANVFIKHESETWPVTIKCYL